jgi:hypothetical protein
MEKFWITKNGDDVVITRTSEGVDESIRLPHKIFQEVAEELKSYPDAEGYPIQLEVKTGMLEIPYEDFLRLASALTAN